MTKTELSDFSDLELLSELYKRRKIKKLDISVASAIPHKDAEKHARLRLGLGTAALSDDDFSRYSVEDYPERKGYYRHRAEMYVALLPPRVSER